MPTQPTPTATGYRLVVLLLLIIVLGVVHAGYLYVKNGALAKQNQYVTNNYKMVRDSVRKAPPAQRVYVPIPGPVVYRPLPVSAAQLASIRQSVTADVASAVRREVAKLVPKAPKVTLTQKPMVLALHDSVNVTRKPGTNKLSLNTLKTGSFQDKWLSLSTVVRPGKNGRPDSMEVKYQLRNEYDVNAWVKRTKHKFWPFGKRRIYVSLTSRNPNAHDTGLEAIPVKKATKKP